MANAIAAGTSLVMLTTAALSVVSVVVAVFFVRERDIVAAKVASSS
jgi:hypothetical protein